MKTVYLIYTKYYDFDNCKLTIGGVQTYIKGLGEVCQEMGFLCKVYQTGESTKEVALENGICVYQVNTKDKKKRKQKIQLVVNQIMKEYNDEEDLLIFLANEITCENTASRTIALQHGISWDYLYDKPLSKLRNAIHYALKSKNSFKLIKNLNHVKCLVCVDYNFPNWVRSTAIKCDTTLKVIPNFTPIAPAFEKPTDRINIIFARRFFPFRGTRIFGPAIANILAKYDNVYVTIAGDGPDEEYLRDMVKDYSNRVTFIKYSAEEALAIHADKHIALVPTIGSEGTSLSCLEAMSAQCAVICTDAGGLSNIVLDGFNGLYTERTAQDLEDKIGYLINNPNERKKIAENGFNVIKQGFSFEIWKQRWKQIIAEITNK